MLCFPVLLSAAMYCDDELNQMWLQAEFLAVVNDVKPEVCCELYTTAFGLYKEILCPPVTWETGKYRLHDPHDSQIKALSDALDAWAVKWNLMAEWCKEAAYFTLQVWADSSKPGEFFWCPPTTREQLRYPHPEGLPLYQREFGRECYLNTLELLMREAVADHPLLKLGEAEKLGSFIESVRNSATIEEYCKRVEAASPPFTAKEKRKLYQHLKWAIEFQVAGKSFEEIKVKSNVTEKAVEKAVREILQAMDLEERPRVKKKSGRPKGSRTVYHWRDRVR
ncbi:MAG TPA: hypothetical protein VMZ30_13795 [Pyrinomonadaceae bacterium]|nr:hypothetical protein [Pyrinomonadaceae bacterium]